MGCRVCCCCSPRAGARVVGLIDLIGGILGVIYGGWWISSIQAEEKKHEKPLNATDHYDDYNEALWAAAFACIFPAVLAVIVGMTILISVAKNNICIGRVAYFLNIVLILGAVVAFVTLFVLGYHWLNILDLPIVAIIQSFFICGIQDFIKLELSIESV